MKQIMVIYYSQTGQLNSILHSVLAPLEQDPEFSIEYRELVPKVPYPFPWSAYQFCDVFPEAVAGIPEELDTTNQDGTGEPDLVILAYTVWYLSPSIPISSFLQSHEAARLLQNRRVLTLIGCRNMWLLAQERVKSQVSALGGQVVGNIALTERTGNLLGILNIATWMLSGEKKPLLSLLPPPGIAEEDIRQARRFGELIRQAWTGRDRLRLDQAELNAHGAVRIDPALMLMEKRIWPVFQKWSAFIRKKGIRGDGARKKRVYAFMIYLLLAVVILAPFSRLASLLQRLVKNKKIQEEMRYYSLG